MEIGCFLLPHGLEPALVVRVSIDHGVYLGKDGRRHGAGLVLRNDSNAWLEALEVGDGGSIGASDKVHAVSGKPSLHNCDDLAPEVCDPSIASRLVTRATNPGRSNVTGILLHIVFSKVDYGVDGPGRRGILSIVP